MPEHQVPHPVPHPELAAYVLGLLGPDEAEAFEEHLAGCDVCRAEVGELSALPRLLEEVAPPVAVPAGLGARTLGAVERAAQAQHRARRWRRAASAAAVVLLLASTAVAIGRAGRGPDEREVALKAGPGTTAQGSAYVRQQAAGTDVRLDLRRLAPTTGGRYYECWYISGADRPGRPDRVTAGTFTVGADGRARVRMLTAARFERYPRMAITLEPADGDPGPTGPEVLSSGPPS